VRAIWEGFLYVLQLIGAGLLGLLGVFLLITAVFGVGALQAAIPNIVRARRIRAKYSDPEVAENLIKRRFWIGMTPQHVVDALGEPLVVERKGEGDRAIEIFKYDHQPGRGYRKRIQFQNGSVIRWTL
jgi:hypothetical protein